MGGAREPHGLFSSILVVTWEPAPERCLRVNPGGEPGRDEGGLPPVDVEIPDDARELDREVLAYRRELRARRRRARWDRLLGPLRGHGALLPLVASCVALSMLAGTLLSVFSISPASAPVLSNSAGPAPQTIPSLPKGTVFVGGKATPVRSLVHSVLVLVPKYCGCIQALQQVTSQAARAGVQRVYFVGTTNKMADVTELTRIAGQGTAVAVKDATNVLGAAYHPAGLTIVLVRSDATTTVQRKLVAGRFRLEEQLRTLGTTPESASPTPGSAVSVAPAPT
jgi:hypothetical protein